MSVTSEPVQVTPAQLQYEIVGKPLEHSHPDFPELDTCKPLAILHITESKSVVGELDGTEVGDDEHTVTPASTCITLLVDRQLAKHDIRLDVR